MFKDHFSGHAADYARHRPTYPDSFFAWLASVAPSRDLAWDCGTGNGQAAHGLARHFTHVVATDASAAQIANAVPHERITYRTEPAESTSLRPGSADLVLVAQAMHWFDFDGFFAEVRRVLKSGGVLAAAAYGRHLVSPEIDRVSERYYTEIIGPYWPPERHHIDEAYRTIPFPFPEVEPPVFELRQEWSMHDLLAYLATWSATKAYEKTHGADPLKLIRADLAEAWGDPDQRRAVKWPLYLRVGYNRST